MRKFLMGLLITMLLFIFGVTALVTRSLAPLKQARAETIALAERRADLTDADDFYWYNGDETFFTVTGKNSQDEAIIVIVQQDGGAIELFNQEDVMTEKEAVTETYNREHPAKILEARIGMYEGEAVWEVSFRLENGQTGYTLLSLTSGEWIRTIKNI